MNIHDPSASSSSPLVDPVIPVVEVSDFDLAPWLLVSRRRGRARGRGGVTHANPEAGGTAAAESPEERRPRYSTFSGTCGGRSGLNLNRSLNSKAINSAPISFDVTAMESIPTNPISTINTPSVSLPTVDEIRSDHFRDYGKSLNSAPSPKAIQPITPSNQVTRCLDPPNLGTKKILPFGHSNSPPPILHTSLQIPLPYPS